MATDYNYTISGDFPSGVSIGQLDGEIRASSITVELLGVTSDTDLDSVVITFASALSPAEVTTLNNIVSSHVPADIPTNVVISAEGYISITSSLPDNEAIRIVTTDVVGGIDIDAGIGGITIDSQNTVAINAAAASNFSTSSGNLSFSAAGLVNINSSSGINIGNNPNAQPINVGTSASARTVTVGNMTTSSQVDVRTGTGGFNVDTANGGAISLDSTGSTCNFTSATNADGQDLYIALTGGTDSSIILSSAGVGSDAIKLDAVGGIDIDCGAPGFDLDTTSDINLATSKVGGNTIILNAPNGGIGIVSGVFGLSVNAIGSGVIFIGNNADTGDITVGDSASARRIVVGNSNTTTSLYLRSGSKGLLKTQPSHTALADANTNLTPAEVLTGILSGAPTLIRTLTLPDASTFFSALSSPQTNDSVDFSVINTSLTSGYDVDPGSGGTVIGNDLIPFGTSGSFRLRFTSGTTYNVYRLG